LVFDASDGSFGIPVEGGVGDYVGLVNGGGVVVGEGTEIGGDEFLFGDGHELVDTEGVGVVFGVGGFNVIEVIDENGESVVEFFSGEVLVVFTGPVFELGHVSERVGFLSSSGKGFLLLEEGDSGEG